MSADASSVGGCAAVVVVVVVVVLLDAFVVAVDGPERGRRLDGPPPDPPPLLPPPPSLAPDAPPKNLRTASLSPLRSYACTVIPSKMSARTSRTNPKPKRSA